MKRHALPIVACALMMAPTVAMAQQPSSLSGLYVGLTGGFALISDQDIDVDVGELANVADVEIDYDPGYRFGGFVGYQIDTNIRIQADLSYIAADGENTFSFGGVDLETDQELSILSGTAGVYFDLWPINIVVPYVGGGIGWSRIEVDNDDLNDVEQDVFTAFAEAGVPFTLTPSFSIAPTARFTWYQTDEEDDDVIALGDLDLERSTIGEDLYSTDLMVAVRYTF